MANRCVGILGGMGPAATLHFASQYLDACDAKVRSAGGAPDDRSYPEHWIVQARIPDRTAALVGMGESPVHTLMAAMTSLATVGARVIAMPCNTAHAWHSEVQSAFPQIDLLNIADEVARVLTGANVTRVLLLATTGTVQAGIYQRAASELQLQWEVPAPRLQSQLMEGIYFGVKAGDMPRGRKLINASMESAVRESGADAVLMACTEIPLVVKEASLPLFDAGAVLAGVLADRSFTV